MSWLPDGDHIGFPTCPNLQKTAKIDKIPRAGSTNSARNKTNKGAKYEDNGYPRFQYFSLWDAPRTRLKKITKKMRKSVEWKITENTKTRTLSSTSSSNYLFFFLSFVRSFLCPFFISTFLLFVFLFFSCFFLPLENCTMKLSLPLDIATKCYETLMRWSQFALVKCSSICFKVQESTETPMKTETPKPTGKKKKKKKKQRVRAKNSTNDASINESEKQQTGSTIVSSWRIMTTIPFSWSL